MSGEGTYKCTLDAKSVEKAKKELNEDPKQRASHIETLRDWVKAQPHITCRTDDDFLLRFLRVSKFSQLKAQERIDKFCTVRSSEKDGVPEWFTKLDPLGDNMQEMLKLGPNMPLPGYDDQGRKVILISTGGYDPAVHDFADVMRLGFINTDINLIEEEVQVNGIVILLDFSLFTASHALYWGYDTINKAMKCWQDVYPQRNKAINYYNTPTLFNAVFEIFKYFMKEKLKERLHFHKADLESLHKQVPKRMLPTELGGDAGPLEELKKNWKEHVEKHRDEVLANMVCKVDESKRPVAEPVANGGGDWPVIGSFRKLAVD